MLHLLNGDATAAVFPAALPGERAVWRDILMEGPAGADAETRAAWLAPRLGVAADAYARGWRDGEATLARAREHDEIVLWFEQDLFCATNLWFVLDRLAGANVSLVFPSLGDGPRGAGFMGLGTLATDAFAPLLEQRQRLAAAALAEARGLWRAYAAPEPTALVRLEPALPFARRAIRLHCGRFPSVGRGLDEVEHATLAALDGALTFGALFRAVTAAPDLRALGLGDVQLAATLRDLAAGATPLVRLDASLSQTPSSGVLSESQTPSSGALSDTPFARWRVSRTAAGADVLAGHAERLALAPLDRWLGGVHQAPGTPLWRWDGRALVRA